MVKGEVMYSKEPTWDTPYGNYNDFDPDYWWADDFNPSAKERAFARSEFKDFLCLLAEKNHLDPSEWEEEDFDIFREIMDI